MDRYQVGGSGLTFGAIAKLHPLKVPFALLTPLAVAPASAAYPPAEPSVRFT